MNGLNKAMKIEIAFLCACVLTASATYVHGNRYQMDEPHINHYPGFNFDLYKLPFFRGNEIGRRSKRAIYSFQFDRLRNQINDNGLGQWRDQGFSQYGIGSSRFGRLGSLAAQLSSGNYW